MAAEDHVGKQKKNKVFAPFGRRELAKGSIYLRSGVK